MRPSSRRYVSRSPPAVRRLCVMVPLLAGCAPAGELRVTAHFGEPHGLEWQALPEVQVGPGEITLTDAYATGSCHLWISRGVTLSRDAVLTVWVRARGERLFFQCDDAAHITAFRVRISGLAPGTYRLERGYRADATGALPAPVVIPPAGYRDVAADRAAGIRSRLGAHH
jgi:hypothetical protein